MRESNLEYIKIQGFISGYKQKVLLNSITNYSMDVQMNIKNTAKTSVQKINELKIEKKKKYVRDKEFIKSELYKFFDKEENFFMPWTEIDATTLQLYQLIQVSYRILSNSLNQMGKRNR